VLIRPRVIAAGIERKPIAGPPLPTETVDVTPEELPLARRLLYRAGWWTCHLVATSLLGVRVHGYENVPMNGPLIIVANHQSNLDPPLVGVAVRRPYLSFIARVGLFGHPAFGKLLWALNAIPVRRGESDLPAMKEAINRLKQGHGVVVFAEGARTLDGKTHEFMRGATMMIKRGNCPVLPVGLEGPRDVLPRGGKLPKLFGSPCYLEIGKPIDPHELLTDGPDEALRRLGAEVERLRLVSRERIRRATRGRYPAPGPSDEPAPTHLWYTPDSPDAGAAPIRD
jgi:1-acyl-sn-glycerol-3-phosphate acyltransferase